MSKTLNPQSSNESKKQAQDIIFDSISEILFDRVNLLNNPSLVTSTLVTSTATYGMLLRVPDTAKGKYLRPDRISRIRLIFYFTGAQSKTIGYILSPCVYNSQVAPTDVSQLDSYVGIKVSGGKIYLVTKVDGVEKTKDTDLTVTDSTTRILDIQYNINSADISVDNQFLGTMETKMNNNINSLQTFYPLIAPIKSTDGTGVQINIENYQFLQDK